MKKIIYLSAACAAAYISFFCPMYIAHAATHITSGNIYSDTTWNATDSPYILDDAVTVTTGHTLTLMPGTEIYSAPSPDGMMSISVLGGSLDVQGSSLSPVKIHDITGIYFYQSSSTMSHLDMTGAGLISFGSSINISSSTLTGATQALNTKESYITIRDSDIHDNTDGIVAEKYVPIFQVRGNDPLNGTGGIGNALETYDIAQSTYGSTDSSSTVVVTNSSLMNNSDASIKSSQNKTIDAKNNWWGSNDGPMASSSNVIIGNVDYDPWLRSDPSIARATCCSSVLFLPGIEGTRLYRPESPTLGIGNKINQLWEPQTNNDLKKLYLDTNGSSTDNSIYSDGLITYGPYGFYDVYGTFSDFMDKLVRQGTIGEWKAFGYDWRKPIAEVVAGAEKKATTTESLIQTVEDIASRSKTGKVTLIAHSNGGLVAKYLMKTLADQGKADLVDSLISVAVPYLGTPEALAALLHGDDQSLFYGLIPTADVARGLAANMPSVYSLLPSREYFEKVLTPSIAFASTTVPNVNKGAYPQKINSYDSQSAFVTDAYNNRKKAAATNLALPIKGNKLLVSAADVLHSIIDNFTWPTALARWAIVGLGNKTTSNVTYSPNWTCSLPLLNRNCPSHTDNMTNMGDGTVVAPSASYDAGNVITADLGKISSDENNSIEHKNILNASSTEQQILSIIKSGSTSTGGTNGALVPSSSPIPLAPGMSWGEPDYSHEPTILTVSTHSPVELHVYDAQGRHTGVIPKPDAMKDVEDGLYTYYETKIPGSSFHVQGSSVDLETFIYLPDTGSQKFTVVMKGTGIGTFTYDVDRTLAGVNIGHVEYAAMPVTPLTVASTSVTAAITDDVQATSTVVTAAPLVIDIDGDGKTDMVATSSDIAEAGDLYLQSLRQTIVTLLGSSKRATSLLARIDHIIALNKKGKLEQVHDASDRLENRIGHLKLRGLTPADRDKLVNQIDIFISQFEP